MFLFHSCNKKCENKGVTASIDTLSLHDGDLIFREGRSTESQVVTSLDSGSYSHVGIMLHTKDGWRVIHAVPNETENELDTVKYESISSFIQPDKCIKAKVIRVSLSGKVVKGAIQYALQKVGMPFDKDFDITDTTTFYCTELVWRAYKHVGIDISKGRRHHINLLGFNKTCILPSDIMPNETNCTLSNKAVLPQSKNWKVFVAGLEQQGITTHFKTKGNTDVIQGIIFVKDGCSFSGSKIDRSCSFARLNETLNQNSQQQQYEQLAQVSKVASEGSSNFLTELSEALGESFTLPTSNAGVDVDEIRFQKKLRKRANRQRKI